jgi:hypothetical protein
MKNICGLAAQKTDLKKGGKTKEMTQLSLYSISPELPISSAVDFKGTATVASTQF